MKNIILQSVIIVTFAVMISGCGNNNDVIDLLETKSNVEDTGAVNENQNGSIVVYVNGAVKNPGVYTLNPGDRVYQAISQAGGMKNNAKKDQINLAETVVDAQNIRIMTKKEYNNLKAKNKSGSNAINNEPGSEDTDSGLININTTDEEGLMKLPGIGEAKARAIMTYRQENGEFKSKEEIKNVSGIGDATYANIKDMITV